MRLLWINLFKAILTAIAHRSDSVFISSEIKNLILPKEDLYFLLVTII
jgi:hypothetical protein